VFTRCEKALGFRKATILVVHHASAQWAQSNAIAVARFSLVLPLVTDRTSEV
jgi:hypothetical protein